MASPLQVFPKFRPLPPRKPYTPAKPQKAKAMTIAIGFPYKDGILVCADTQMTYATGTKFSDHKIFAEDIENCPCIFAFADQSGLAAEIRSKIFRRIREESHAELTTQQVQDVVETVLNEHGRLYTDLPLEFLLAVCPPKTDPSIIHFDGKSLNAKYGEPVVLGCGNDSLTRYLTDNLFLPNMERMKALVFGSYVTRKATQYIQHCGEPIEAFSLTKEGSKQIDEQEVSWAATLAEQQEVKMDKWMFKRV